MRCTGSASTSTPGKTSPTAKNAPQPKVAPIQRQRTITIGQQRFLERLLVEAGWTEARLLDYFGIQSTAELPMAEFDRALKALQQAKRRAA